MKTLTRPFPAQPLGCHCDHALGPGGLPGLTAGLGGNTWRYPPQPMTQGWGFKNSPGCSKPFYLAYLQVDLGTTLCLSSPLNPTPGSGQEHGSQLSSQVSVMDTAGPQEQKEKPTLMARSMRTASLPKILCVPQVHLYTGLNKETQNCKAFLSCLQHGDMQIPAKVH